MGSTCGENPCCVKVDHCSQRLGKLPFLNQRSLGTDVSMSVTDADTKSTWWQDCNMSD